MDKLTLLELSNELNNNSDSLVVIVFHGLAGDCMYISPPGRESILVDCGFHKGDYITNAIKELPGRLKHIIITHQHLDHFATLGKFVYEFSLDSNTILHSGLAHPQGVVPHENLTTCGDYDDLEIPLWHQYSSFIENDTRWVKINTTSKNTEIVNLLPEKVDRNILSKHYGALNYTSTPIGIKHFDHRIVIGSDINPEQFKYITETDKTSFLDNISLFIPASHGRPHHNPKWLLEKCNPKYVCLNDSFPDSDFTQYYKDILPYSDIRTCNVDRTQAYFFTKDSVERFGVNFEQEMVAA
jgi:hypothetical protein